MASSRPISIYRKIAITFIVLTLLLAAVVVYFSIVSVKIVIIPNKERTAANFLATVKDAKSQASPSGAVINGLVEKIFLSAEESFGALGKEVNSAEVVGTVTIYNKTNSDQPLIKTTRLLSPDDKLFRLKQTVRVPANGQLEKVEVYADQAAKEMAIAPTKFIIPGLNQTKQDLIYAESASPFEYRELGETLVSAEDLQKAKEILTKQLADKLQAMTAAPKYQNYDNVISKVNDNAIIFNTAAKLGDKVKEFRMSAATEAAIVAFNTNEVAELARQKVAESLPDDKRLESFDKNNFQYSVDKYDVNRGTADLKIEVAAQMVLKEGTEIIKADRLVGLNRQQLDDYLSSLREVAGYEVKFTPNWINKVPSLLDHIKVEVAK
ncbi:hypothetical protein A3G56_03060 [Candidatus Falkowbacteria bacterium RIFCSPLOWO2_12_FULL_45_10]|uniref:Baseplate protein J-like domain-containing protein n=2 Tax=Candidatus Falkowiibacteriota TaxID=1752728 RepID=A0A1F5RWT8_9BACT|nr:MAG: hypothetical protein A3D54_02730 [Candidatus Falkowbacteria bacterium RIFCSPHIGHO2_02_FULL_45_15]OGF18717.1 MAG: hypothetical protein A3G56_03060 [Candidatus Falkowbacteria bacterium RIFCSPLOWO2_12_FULL_45_10]